MMKPHLFLVILALSFVMSGCFMYKELPVEYDYSYKGRFNKYRSYDFVTQASDRNDETIKSAIASHMRFLGYKQKDKKPDLLLYHKVFYDSLKFKGYVQPDIEEFVKRPNSKVEYNPLDFKLSKGTLLIQIFDRKQEQSIWQGYATEVYGQVDFADVRDVRNAVRSILNKYQFFAEGFMEAQEEVIN